MQYDALLFDNDGVILERTSQDRPTFEGAVQDAFRTHGVMEPEPAHVRELVYGVTIPNLKSICESYGIDVDAFWQSRDEECSRVQREAITNGEKGLYSDVEALKTISGPLGVVSTNQQATLEFAYEKLDVPSFDVVQGRPATVESLARKKPAPYYLESALDAIGAETALYVGDSEHDVVAAQNAGIVAVFLRRNHNETVSLGATPDYEIKSLSELTQILN